jgi:hypothetical protein
MIPTPFSDRSFWKKKVDQMNASLRETLQRAVHVVVACLLALALVGPAAPTRAEVSPSDNLLQFTSGGHILGFNAGGVVVATGSHAYRVQFVNAATTPVADTSAAHEGSGAPPLSRVTYPDLWPGISLAYDAPDGALLRSTYRLEPHADPALIRLRYNVPVQVDPDGGLALHYAGGTMRESAPLAWQEIDGQRVPVAVAFRPVKPGAEGESREVGFSLGAYDPAHPLTIDPDLTWNTFLGGSDWDLGNGIAVDGSGNVYVAGVSYTTWGSPIRDYSGGEDAFAAKLDSSGELQWHTFLGGSGDDTGLGIAVDGSSNVYVAGASYTAWGSPIRPYGGFCDTFVVQLDSRGTLQWHTFLGGSSWGARMAIDGSSNVYVTGLSSGTWGTPIRPHSGSDTGDIFAAKFDGDDGALQWNTFLGGSGDEDGFDIAVDGSGNVYVAGASTAAWGAPIRAHSGAYDAFAAKLDSSGALQWNTFLGGDGDDHGIGIGVDGRGDVYVAGVSDATWGSPIRDYSGGYIDIFAAKFDGNDGALQWNTFLGGSESDIGYSIGVDGSGNVYVAGNSAAAWGSPLRAYSSSIDALIAQLDSGGVLQWHTFLGESGYDTAWSIVVDKNRNVYVAGTSQSTWGAPVRDYSGDYDAFVAKLSPAPEIDVQGNSQSIANGSATPSAADHTDFGATAVSGGTVVHTFTISNGSSLDALTLTGSPPVTLTAGAHFSVSAQPSSLIPANSTTSFDITFDPSATGSFTDTVTIPNNDGDENPYTFVISGTGTMNQMWYLPLILKGFP